MTTMYIEDSIRAEQETIPMAHRDPSRPKRSQRGHPSTSSDKIYSDRQLEFLKAVEAYKRDHKRSWPTWCELLDIVDSLGYRQVASPQDAQVGYHLPETHAA
jgi:hypothetical protein